MSLKKYMSLNDTTPIPFAGSDVRQILEFVQRYDNLYGKLGKLEEQVQEILKAQEIVVDQLKSTRIDEELFFVKVSAESDIEISVLKKIGAEIANANKVKTI